MYCLKYKILSTMTLLTFLIPKILLEFHVYKSWKWHTFDFIDSNKMIKIQYTFVGPIPCPAFVYVSLLDEEPEKENCVLWSDFFLFPKTCFLIVCQLMTQYQHINPYFNTQRKCRSTFDNNLCLDILPLVGLWRL